MRAGANGVELRIGSKSQANGMVLTATDGHPVVLARVAAWVGRGHDAVVGGSIAAGDHPAGAHGPAGEHVSAAKVVLEIKERFNHGTSIMDLEQDWLEHMVIF